MKRRVLVIAAHADDEALGCGGTISRHVAEGDCVDLLLMADGVKSRLTASDSDLESRNASMREAKKILGISSVECLGLPDNRMDTLPTLDIIQRVEGLIGKIRPEIIYTHHYGDLNVDHRITHDAVLTACRPMPGYFVREIYGFEVISSTDWATVQKDPFLPTHFVNIDNYLENKMASLKAYLEEMRAEPHSRSLNHAEVLARHRGYCVGLSAAEAFMVYRQIR